jgi:hypothetical protein
MKEINLLTNQFLNLTAQGVANTKILLQNQGPDVMYIFKQATAPTMANPAMALFNWQSVEVDNSGGDIWVASQQPGTIFVSETSDLGVASTIEFPPDMYTSTTEGFRRLRVDQGQTGFVSGREFRTFFEFNIPAGNVQTLKFNSPIDFILWEQNLEIDAGSIRLEVFTGTVTEIATFNVALPKVGKNRMLSRQQPYYTSVVNATTHTVPVALGSSINIASATQTDKLRLVAANATAQQQSVSGGAQSERGIPPGSYYIRLHNFGSGAATGTYSVIWEERP